MARPELRASRASGIVEVTEDVACGCLRPANVYTAAERRIECHEAVEGIRELQPGPAIKDPDVGSASGPRAGHDVGPAIAVDVGDGHGASTAECGTVGEEIIEHLGRGRA